MTRGEQHIYDQLDVRSRALVRVMRDNGIVNPVITLEESRRATLALSYACALLDQESGGGHNVFGHDPTAALPVRWQGTGVTVVKYRVYKARRGATGHGGMQGVGPVQLTWYEKQDRADKAGGCHVPRFNMRVGYEDLAGLINLRGVHAGLKAYNGAGAEAERYAIQVSARQDVWARRFKAVS